MDRPTKGEYIDIGRPPSRGIRGLWTMSEGNGRGICDSSWLKNNCSISGAQWVPDLFGGGLLFDGTNDRATSRHIGIKTNEITMICWLYHAGYSQVQATSYSVQCSQAPLSGPVDYQMHIKAVSGTSGPGRIGGVFGSTLFDPLSGLTVSTGDWHQIALTLSESTMTVRTFIDGILAYENTGTSLQINESADNIFVIGTDNRPNSTYCNGTINYLALYDRALTVGEIFENYIERYQMFDTSFEIELVGIASLIGLRFFLSKIRPGIREGIGFGIR
jgi:hypothetical protein